MPIMAHENSSPLAARSRLNVALDLPAAAGAQDQARVSTPSAAIRSGADYLVVGRPITVAADHVAADGIVAEIERVVETSRKQVAHDE